ncbi:hypothetical protein C900_01331 [Fulvivirga imtechensis AK7]|uniref:DUF2188 domain-containing protein n=1 Tax=Fulvivirga imtechensis AK7 TaxID=1237149 RepID=L8JXD0_9BACT|nr:DUF2188 domain-containing protein [Fulvivirga imtechensis]ELR73721.1 hypothetical protein C900_01331 [Fulvivirga imtechensis AK7]
MDALENSYYVRKQGEQWRVTVNNPLYGGNVRGATKEEAVKKAVALAKTHLPAQILIYSDDGELMEKRIFPRFSDPIRFESWSAAT